MIVEVEKKTTIAVENKAQHLIEITQGPPANKSIEVIEVGPQGPKGDKGDKGDGTDVEVYSGGSFIGLASKVNFAESIKATINNSGIITVTAYTQKQVEVILTAAQVQAGQVTLPEVPLYANLVRLFPEGGVEQINGIDFVVESNVLKWQSKGLEGFLEAGERILVTY